jgi:hypothetical protein
MRVVELRFRSTVSRHHPRMPRLVTVPLEAVVRWKLPGTTVVEAVLDGTPIGRRSLKRWDERRCWWFDLPDPLCRKLGLDVGAAVKVELRRASEDLPAELAALVVRDKAARAAWARLRPAQQRMLRENVLAGKQPATRTRRARKGLSLDTED